MKKTLSEKISRFINCDVKILRSKTYKAKQKREALRREIASLESSIPNKKKDYEDLSKIIEEAEFAISLSKSKDKVLTS